MPRVSAAAALLGLGARIPRNMRGMLFMMLGAFCASIMQAFIRMAAEELHPFEIAFFRNVFGLLVLLPWVAPQGLAPFRTGRPGLQVARGLLNTMAMLAWFTAVTFTPLAQVASLAFSAPLFAALLALLVLREPFVPQRFAVMLLGFAGVLIIVRPGLDVVHAGALLLVFSSFFWACAMMVIKVLSRTDSSLTITLYMGLVMTPMTLLPALTVWQWPSWEALGWCLLTGAFGALGQIGISQAFRDAEATLVLPLDFTRLVWSSALGFFMFAEVPDGFTWLGGTVIFASTTWLTLRSRNEARRA